MHRGETTLGHSFPQDPPRHHRLGESLQFERSQLLAHEYIAKQPQSAGGYECSVRGCHTLQATGQVRSLSDDHLLLRRLLPDGVTHDDHAGCNSDAHLQRFAGREQELTDLRHEIKPDPHGAFSIVLMRLWVAEVGKESVAHESGDISAHLSDHRGARTLESADHVAKVLRIELDGQSRRADEITKKDGHLSSFGLGLRARSWGYAPTWKRTDRSENLFPMAERNAQFLQIGLGHIGQDFEFDGVLGKNGRVLGEPNLIKPSRYPVIDAHCRALSSPKVLLYSYLSATSCRRAAGKSSGQT